MKLNKILHLKCIEQMLAYFKCSEKKMLTKRHWVTHRKMEITISHLWEQKPPKPSPPFFLFWLYPGHAEVLRPGIKPVPQQQHKLQYHKGTPPLKLFYSKTSPYL